MELSNANRKLIKSLATAKGRRESGLFIAEGGKAIGELLPYFGLEACLSTAEWEEAHSGLLPVKPERVSQRDFNSLSQLKTPQGVMALFRIPQSEEIDVAQECRRNLVLALDSVQDPGNLGTIIRTADWFGVKLIMASRETADCFSPKVVQASMGAVGRVTVCYRDLAEELSRVNVSVYGMALDGKNLYSAELSTDSGIIVMGNEGNGISSEVMERVTDRLLIPWYPFSAEVEKVESLNVGIATAVTLSEFRRRGLV